MAADVPLLLPHRFRQPEPTNLTTLGLASSTEHLRPLPPLPRDTTGEEAIIAAAATHAESVARRKASAKEWHRQRELSKLRRAPGWEEGMLRPETLSQNTSTSDLTSVDPDRYRKELLALEQSSAALTLHKTSPSPAHAQPSSSQMQSDPPGTQDLMEMGFERGAVLDALARAGGHIERATHFLLDG